MKKRILFFGKLPPPYIGPAVATEIILNSKLKDKFHLIHFNISHHNNINELGKFNLKNIYITFIFYYRLIYTIIREKPDIVYIPSQQTTIAYIRDIPFWIIVKLFNKKLVCHLRGGYFKLWFNECSIIMKKIIKYSLKLIDAQIVLGENLKNMYKGLIPIDRIFVVPNSADYIIPIKKEYNKQNIFKILFLANFIESKGVIDTIESYFKLPCHIKMKVEFIIAGSWVENTTKTKIKKILNKNPDAPFKIINHISGHNKLELFSDSDIFIFPSYYRNEGHPWVLVEAIACGLAVISTNHAAISQTVVDGYNGYLVEKQNASQIADRVNALVSNPTLLKTMKNNSLILYKNKFTEQNLVDNFTFVFNSFGN